MKIHFSKLYSVFEKLNIMGNFEWNVFSAAFTVDLLAFATGNFYSWSSTALIKLKNEDIEDNPLGRPIVYQEESLIASLLNLGAICGSLMAGICSNTLGRKRTILLFSFPMLTSSLILAFGTTTTEFYIARFIAGVGVGGVYAVVPMYIAEIAETKIRGLLGGIMWIFNVIGVLMAFVSGPFVNFRTFCLIQVVPTGLFILLWHKFVPESPFYYLIKGNEISARRTLIYLRNNTDEKELDLMKETVKKTANSDSSLADMFANKAFRKGLLITTFIMGLQQFMGSVAILSYMEDIFASSGSSLSSSTSTIIVAVLQVCMVSLSTVLIDRWGRRVLLMTSIGTCAVALFPSSGYLWLGLQPSQGTF